MFKVSEESLNQWVNYFASNAGTDCDSFRNRGRWVDRHMSHEGQQTRSSRGSNVPSGSVGKPRTGRRGDTIEVYIDRHQ